MKPARRIVDGDWTNVSSFAIASDGHIVAGENGGYRVCCFKPSGEVAWSHKIGNAGKSSRYSYETFVAIAER